MKWLEGLFSRLDSAGFYVSRLNLTGFYSHSINLKRAFVYLRMVTRRWYFSVVVFPFRPALRATLVKAEPLRRAVREEVLRLDFEAETY